MSRKRNHTVSQVSLNGKPINLAIDWQSWFKQVATVLIALLLSKYLPGFPLPPGVSPFPDVPGHVPTVPPPTPDKPVPKADPVGAIVKVRHGNAFCTGVHLGDLLKSGHSYWMTAAHCTGGVGSSIEIEMATRQRVQCTIVKRDTSADISIARTAMVADYPFALPAKAIAEPGVKVWHKGYGVDRPGNLEKGTVHSTADGSKQTEFRLSVSSGDSGAPIYREDNGEIVGVVCCTSGNRMWGGHGQAAWSMLGSISAVVSDADVPRPIPTFPLDADEKIRDNPG